MEEIDVKKKNDAENDASIELEKIKEKYREELEKMNQS